jgi:hypothetical protein
MAAPLLLLAWTGLALGQAGADKRSDSRPTGGNGKAGKPTKPAVKSLTEMLAEALKNNPDLRVAQARLREAEAELRRTRLQVIQKIVAFHHALESQKIRVQLAAEDQERIGRLAGSVSAAEANAIRKKLLLAKAKLAEMEAELPYLLGQQQVGKVEFSGPGTAISPPRGTAGASERVQPVRGTMAEKIRKALDVPVPVKIDKDTPFKEVLEFLEDKVPGITFRIVEGKKAIKTLPIELTFKQKIPLGAALQALGDGVPGLRFAVREYGVLVTWEEQLPPGAVLLHDFWKGDAGKDGADSLEKSGDHPAAKTNPPAEPVHGQIKTVDATTGLVELDVGSARGLIKGHTLEVYRLKPRPQYLGTILIAEVQDKKAVGKLISRRVTLKVGDQVANRIVPR